jgi:hypothetical protein
MHQIISGPDSNKDNYHVQADKYVLCYFYLHLIGTDITY